MFLQLQLALVNEKKKNEREIGYLLVYEKKRPKPTLKTSIPPEELAGI
jgi:hypothetical protein